MGKFVVCADHPSNEFFRQFPNCILYGNSDGFVQAVSKALAEEPEQLTDAQRHELSWEAATERFLSAAELDQPLTRKPQRSRSKKFLSLSLQLGRKFDDASAYLHHVALGFEGSRKAFGAVPGSLHPDEQQCKELGLASPSSRRSSRNWLNECIGYDPVPSLSNEVRFSHVRLSVNLKRLLHFPSLFLHINLLMSEAEICSQRQQKWL